MAAAEEEEEEVEAAPIHLLSLAHRREGKKCFRKVNLHGYRYVAVQKNRFEFIPALLDATTCVYVLRETSPAHRW